MLSKLLMPPAIQPYPFERVPKLGRRDAARLSACARWLQARPGGPVLARAVGGPVRVIAIHAGRDPGSFDPYAARCALRIAGEDFTVAISGGAIRAIAQRLLGGPNELDAARPSTPAEHAIAALVAAAALEDLGIAGDVWPDPAALATGDAIEVALDLAGEPASLLVGLPRALELRVAPPRPLAAWTETVAFELPIVLGRCALATAALEQLAVRDVITLERAAGNLELVVGDGRFGLRAQAGAVVAAVATGYVGIEMGTDPGTTELTVAVGTTRLTLRQLAELAIGEVVTLGKPLAGPFELRAAGRVLGRGELVDVDGELGVRIVSLGDQP